jgi:hypothetical protein
MNNFYEQKARKYKYKYLKLKQEIEGGGAIFGTTKILGKRIFVESKAQKEANIERIKQQYLPKLSPEQLDAFRFLSDEREGERADQKLKAKPMDLKFSVGDFKFLNEPTLAELLKSRRETDLDEPTDDEKEYEEQTIKYYETKVRESFKSDAYIEPKPTKASTEETNAFILGLTRDQREGFEILYSKRREQLKKLNNNPNTTHTYEEYSIHDFIKAGCPTKTDLNKQQQELNIIVRRAKQEHEAREYEEYKTAKDTKRRDLEEANSIYRRR